MVATYLDTQYDGREPSDYPWAFACWVSNKLRTRTTHRMVRLLDLGAGTGDFARAFSGFNWEVTASDMHVLPSLEGVATIRNADLSSQQEGFWDAVLSRMVLEHLTDPTDYLQTAWKALRPGGFLVVMVPDWRTCSRHFYDDYTHVRPYDVRSLPDLIRTHGFEIREARTVRQIPGTWYEWSDRVHCSLLGLLPYDFLVWLSEKTKDRFWRFCREKAVLVIAQKT